jgi:uncharacterized protein YodC (DUF2158 family)
MTDKPKFEQGTIVVLKSGGPKMTTTKCFIENDAELSDEDGTLIVSAKTYFYLCNWFVKDQLKEGRFPEEVLQIIL